MRGMAPGNPIDDGQLRKLAAWVNVVP